MKHLSRKNIEGIASKVLQEYKQLSDVKNMEIYKIEPRLLLNKVLGLTIDSKHLSADRSVLDLTSFCEIGIEIFDDEQEDTFYFLDGRTVLIEKDLEDNSEQIGRYNFTLAHEGGHQILKKFFPNDYGVKERLQVHCYKMNSEKRNQIVDWEEWQANSLASALLLPEELIKRGEAWIAR